MTARQDLAFPFIVGCGRSGTTLVRAMLDAHPAVAVPDESYFPVWFARRRARYEQSAGFSLAAFADDLIEHEWFGRWGLEPSDVRMGLAAADPGTFADAVRASFSLYAESKGKPRYADKTPIFVVHIPMLAAIFPEAVFIHVVRDGRAVALSRMEASWSTERVDHEALLWRSQVCRGRADGRALGPDRYREVRYEDLLDDPERVARSLCDFAALAYAPEMLRYHERSVPLVAALKFPDEHRNLVRPPTKGLRDWQTDLRAKDLTLFEALAGDALETFGYERVNPSAPLAVRIQASWSRVRYAGVSARRTFRSRVARVLRRA